jgi:hypothetical protein
VGELDEGSGLSEPVDGESDASDDEWPSLSELELEVSISESMPGVDPPDADPEDA